MTTRPERAAGWLRLGCGTALFAVVPLWLGWTAMWVHLWGDEWFLDFGWPGPVTLLGIEVIWFVAAARTALWLAVLALGALALLGGARVLQWAVVRYGDTRTRERYDAVVGDGAVVRPDAWDGAADQMEPDPTDPGEETAS